jgi:putative copper export protein
MYGVILLLHVLGATIWTGGHLVLALAILPRVLKERTLSELLRFESAYERIGIPALIIQVVTGLWLAHRMVPNASQWFTFDDPVSRLVGAKLFLLAITVAFALDARLRITPRLSEENLTSLAWHIVSVTIVSVLFIVVGVSFRTGWLY